MSPPVSKKEALAMLGLSPRASREDIRRSYRRLAFEYHPDRHAGRPEMEQRFKRLFEAYQALISDAAAADAPPADMPRRGRDLRMDLRVDFMEAAAGGEVRVRVDRPFVCPACDGEGGKGCRTCGGAGEVFEEAVVRVRLPSGLEEGEEVRILAEGAPGESGGRPGDLILRVAPARHPALERRGLDVHSEVSVPRFRLISGGTVRVFTVQGGAHVEIPPRTKPGRSFRLKGWGIRRNRGGRTFTGDHVVRLVLMPDRFERGW